MLLLLPPEEIAPLPPPERAAVLSGLSAKDELWLATAATSTLIGLSPASGTTDATGVGKLPPRLVLEGRGPSWLCGTYKNSVGFFLPVGIEELASISQWSPVS